MKTKKITYKEADKILKARVLMFDRATNKMFGTKWVKSISVDWEVVWVLEEQVNQYDYKTGYNVRFIKNVKQEHREVVEKEYV